MSIRSVFFDFYNTLSYFHPTREERHARAWAQYGIDMPLATVRQAYVQGDHYWTLENARQALYRRSQEGWHCFTANYEQCLLKAAGVEVSKGLAGEIYEAYASQEKSFRLFEDVLPSLTSLREAGLTLGVISNSDVDVTPFCRDLGVAEYFSFILSSCDVGYEKPDNTIFQAALSQAGVKPGEVVHVGDQYHSDVVGAWAVGITPFLLDRFSLLSDLKDCQRIQGFEELLAYLGLPLWMGAAA